MKKKIFMVIFLPVLMLACLMSIKTAKAETKAEFYFEVPQGVVYQGDTIEIKIKLKVVNAIVPTLNFEVKYDKSLLEYVSPKQDEGIIDSTDNIFYDATTKSLFCMYEAGASDSTYIKEGDHLLCTLTFKVRNEQTIYPAIETIFDLSDVALGIMVGNDMEEMKPDEVKVSSSIITLRSPLSDDASLKDIQVSNGTLQPNFSRDNKNYTVTVENNITYIDIKGIPNHSEANAVTDGDKNLKVGENKFTIKVTAENGKTMSDVYNITVIRKMSSDALLSSITLSDYATWTEAFNPLKEIYNIVVPYKYSKIKVDYTKSSSVANADFVSGKEVELKVGNNPIVINVTAEDGTTKKTYTLNVTRAEASTDALLKELIADCGDIKFSPDKYNYSITVPYKTVSVKINAKVNYSEASVQETITKELAEGENIIQVVVTAEDGKTKKTYTINVVRTYASKNADLKEIIFNGSKIEGFTPEKTEYEITVENNVLNAEFSASLYDDKAKGLKFDRDKAALNVGSNTFKCTVTAEDGATTKTYTITVTRKASSDNTLKGLKPDNGDFTEKFSPDKTDYTINLPWVNDTISFECEVNESNAKVNKENSYKLEAGNATVIEIKVTAQNGDVRTYKITVNRKAPSTDHSLKSLEADNGKLTPAFSPDIKDYNINVGYDIKTMKFCYKGADLAKCGLSGNENLKVGENKFTINVTSEDGNSTSYNIIVVRGNPSTDNTLKSLETNIGTLSPEFSASILEYTMIVPYKTETADFKFITNDKNAQALQNTDKLTAGVENRIEITVTAQSGAKKIYVIKIFREAPVTDSSLKSIVPSVGNLTPEFSPETTVYDIFIGYRNDTIIFDCILANEKSKYEISGPDELKIGENNTFTITVTAEDNSKTYYIINVHRLVLSTDSTLSKLEIDGAYYEFDPSKKEYSVEIPKGTKNASIKFEPNNEYAKAVIEGNENLDESKINEVKITVTAEDGSVSVYKINIGFRDIENDTTLSNLKCNESELKFETGITDYELKVPFVVNKVTFEYALSSKFANAVFNGPEELKIGENNLFTITVTAENGDKNIYKINVFRNEKSSDTSIKKLYSDNPLVVFDFDPSKKYIEIKVPYSVGNINFKWELSSEYASAEITGAETLEPNINNVFTINVTAEDGSKESYTINVFRESISSNNNLSDIIPSDGEISPKFSPDVTEYRITVPYSVTLLMLDCKTEHIAAKAELISNNTLEVGENKLDIVVTAEDGSQKAYVITAVRLDKNSDSTLKSLKSNIFDIEFKSDVKDYAFEVEYNIAAILFEYETSSIFAKAEMKGNEELALGDNIFVITVTAENGTSTDYTIKVKRNEKSSDKSIAKLTIAGKEIDIADGQTEFNFDLLFADDPSDIEVILNNKYAQYDIALPQPFVVGENKVVITVTAEDGSKQDYILNVNRRNPSTSAFLIKLIPSVGNFKEPFSRDNLNYTLYVSDTTLEIYFEVETEQQGTIYEIVGNTSLSKGENTVRIIVTAESGTEIVYNVTVFRGETRRGFLASTIFRIGKLNVSVLGFLITAVVIILGCIAALIFVMLGGKSNTKSDNIYDSEEMNSVISEEGTEQAAENTDNIEEQEESPEISEETDNTVNRTDEDDE